MTLILLELYARIIILDKIFYVCVHHNKENLKCIPLCASQIFHCKAFKLSQAFGLCDDFGSVANVQLKVCVIISFCLLFDLFHDLYYSVLYCVQS